MHFQLEPILVVYNHLSGTSDNSLEVQDHLTSLEKRYNLTAMDVQQVLDHKATKSTILSKNIKKVVAIGGDGTINAVLKIAVELSLQLFVVPNGTFNHFAKHAQLPFELESAFGLLGNSKTKKIDVGTVANQYFINFCSVGFYADLIARRIRLQSLGGFKWSSFFRAFWQLFFKYRPIELTFARDSVSITKRTPLVFISNNEIEFGSADMLSRRASFDSGLLQLIIIKDYNRFHFIFLGILSLFFDTRKYIGFEVVKLAEFSIHSRRSKISLAVDGEVFKMQSPIHFSTKPTALNLEVPRTHQ